MNSDVTNSSGVELLYNRSLSPEILCQICVGAEDNILERVYHLYAILTNIHITYKQTFLKSNFVNNYHSGCFPENPNKNCNEGNALYCVLEVIIDYHAKIIRLLFLIPCHVPLL